MALSSIGSNATEEFFETILYGTAYNEAQSQIKEVTKDVDNELLQDAIQSSMTILASGVMMILLRKQEQLIDAIFDRTKIIVLALIGTDFFDKVKNRLKKFKGVKLLKRMGFISSQKTDRIAVAQIVSTIGVGQTNSVNVKNSSLDIQKNTLTQKNYILEKEKHQFSVGSEKAKSYQQTLLFKLFTKNFTDNDKTIIKKIIGKNSSAQISIEDMNKVADFMFVTDNNGEITGLSEQMFQLLNGMGYVHK